MLQALCFFFFFLHLLLRLLLMGSLQFCLCLDFMFVYWSCMIPYAYFRLVFKYTIWIGCSFRSLLILSNMNLFCVGARTEARTY